MKIVETKKLEFENDDKKCLDRVRGMLFAIYNKWPDKYYDFDICYKELDEQLCKLFDLPYEVPYEDSEQEKKAKIPYIAYSTDEEPGKAYWCKTCAEFDSGLCRFCVTANSTWAVPSHYCKKED